MVMTLAGKVVFRLVTAPGVNQFRVPLHLGR
jgi:hypothetical protein